MCYKHTKEFLNWTFSTHNHKFYRTGDDTAVVNFNKPKYCKHFRNGFCTLSNYVQLGQSGCKSQGCSPWWSVRCHCIFVIIYLMLCDMCVMCSKKTYHTSVFFWNSHKFCVSLRNKFIKIFSSYYYKLKGNLCAHIGHVNCIFLF